jgi:outer membrane lipoprotein-sorting protein
MMTGIRLDLTDVQSVMFGEGLFFEEARNHLIDFAVEGKEYVLTFNWDDAMQKLWIDPRLLVVTQSEFYDRDRIVELRHTYRNYRSFDNILLPTKIELVRENQHQRVQVTLIEGEVNHGISDDRFQLHLPSDVHSIDLRDEKDSE